MSAVKIGLSRKAGEEGDPSPQAMGEVRGTPMRDGAKLQLAKRLRRDQTRAEAKLWEQLRNRQLDGHKFVRQAPVGPYVADFLCRERKLIVEVDGATHSTGAEHSRDKTRTAHLGTLGYRVLRLQNVELLEGMDEALAVILETLRSDA